MLVSMLVYVFAWGNQRVSYIKDLNSVPVHVMFGAGKFGDQEPLHKHTSQTPASTNSICCFHEGTVPGVGYG